MNCRFLSKFSCKTSSSEKHKNLSASDDSDVDDDPDVKDNSSCDFASVSSGDLEQKDWGALFNRGNKYYRSKRFDKAIDLYSKALQRSPPSVNYILSNRSAAFSSLSNTVRQIPAAQSERHALFGQDPNTLAELALKDAEKLVNLGENSPKAYYRKGFALYLLEKYEEAKEAYLEGLQINPFSALLLKGMERLKEGIELGFDTSMDEQTIDTLTKVGMGGDVKNSSESRRPEVEKVFAPVKKKRANVERCDEFDCVLCLRMLYNPVTTPCGHTFCRTCLSQALDHNNRCPVCRMVLLVNARSYPISVTLQKILERCFPEEYVQRKSEMEQVILKGSETLPLFVMSVFIPLEKMALNIFEPRYRLMIRRIMEGDHRMGMVGLDEDTGEIADVACEVEITECVSLPDGRFYIEVKGKRRLKILEIWEQDGYRVCKGEYIEDQAPEPYPLTDPKLKEIAETAHALAKSWVERSSNPLNPDESRLEIIANAGEIPPPSDPEALCFWLANRFRLSPRDRLAILRTSNPYERFTIVLNHIEAFRSSRCRLQ